MAEAVVHVLEVVEVEEHDRHRPPVAAVVGERLLDAVAEQTAVRQAREHVVEGLVLELGLELLALADVAHVQDQALDRFVGDQVRGQRFDLTPTVRVRNHQFATLTANPVLLASVAPF